MNEPLNIIFAGSGEFGLPTLRTLLKSGHRLLKVFSQPDRPAGRGKKLTPTPVAQFALDRQLDLVRTGNINAEALPAADVLVVIAFGQKIASHVVDHARLGSVNLHASLLPRYRGAAPINWAIVKGEAVTGNSVIRLAQKMDAGAVLAQSHVQIGELATAGEMHDRLAEEGAPLMLRVLDDLGNGRAVEVIQDESQATLAPKLNRDATKIDWSRPGQEIACRIRGLYPWPGCRVRLVDRGGHERDRITLVRARGTRGVGSPGMIEGSGMIAAGNGSAVEVVEVQPEGKRPMPLSAYRNGHAWDEGMTLESI